jgi:hypothetical protein
MLSDPAAASSPEEAYEMLLNKIFNFTEDNSPTKEGLKVYLDKANISYKKTENTNDRSVRLIIISLLHNNIISTLFYYFKTDYVILSYNYNRLQTGYKLKSKPNFNAPTKEEIEQPLIPPASVNNDLISLIFNFKTGKKKNISKLHMKELIALSILFNLTTDAKCAVMKDNLRVLLEEEINNKVVAYNNINNDNSDSNDDVESVVNNAKTVILYCNVI